MNYQSVAPRSSLAPYVECFWLLSADSVEAAPLEPILPDGCMELIVQLRDPMRRAGADRAQPHVFLCGQLTAPLLLEPSGSVQTFGIRFRPGGARPFSGARPAALHGDRGFTAPFVSEERLSTLFGDGFVQDERQKQRDS